MLTKANMPYSAVQLNGMDKKGTIDLNHIVQRGFVWKANQKSAFIESLILGYPFPAIYAKRIVNDAGKKVYVFLDGKQRLTTTISFLRDEWKLATLPPVTYTKADEDEEVTVDITGMKFSELPEELQEEICHTNFSIVYFEDITPAEEIELFKRINAGQPLSSKAKALASCNDLSHLLEIGEHKLFDDMLSEKKKENKVQAILVMKAWLMLNESIEDVSFKASDFYKVLEMAEVSNDDAKELEDLFGFIYDTHGTLIDYKKKKVAKKLYTETHFVSLIPYFKEAHDSEWNNADMADFIVDFYDTTEGASVSPMYNEAASNAVASNASIVKRDAALRKAFEEFSLEKETYEAEVEKEFPEKDSSENIEISEREAMIQCLDSHGTGFVNGKQRLIQIFDDTGWGSDNNVDDAVMKKRVSKIKDAFGVGGFAHTANANGVYSCDHDSRGMVVMWKDSKGNHTSVRYGWSRVEKMLRELIEKWRKEMGDEEKKNSEKVTEPMSRAEILAERIRDSFGWNEEDCEEFCTLAGMETEWNNREDEDLELIMEEAAKKLGVDIAA